MHLTKILLGHKIFLKFYMYYNKLQIGFMVKAKIVIEELILLKLIKYMLKLWIFKKDMIPINKLNNSL
jgi:hypothetical protein